MYILHFIVIKYLVYFLESMISNIINTYFTFVILYTLAIAISFVLATISEKLIERNGIQYGNALIANIERKNA